MRFAAPHLFWLVWLVPGLIGFLWMRHRSKKQLMTRLGNPQLLERLSHEVSSRREFWKSFLAAFTLFLMIFALARPQFGEKDVRVVRKGVDVMIALDTSLSMLCEDFKPNRLELAKRRIRTLIDEMKGDRVGLVSFAGGSFVQCPLTSDYRAAEIFLNDIDVNTIPRPGTALGDVIRRATRSFSEEEKKYKALVIFSDGEDHATAPIVEAKKAAREGVRIYTVGVGTLDGGPIPLRNPQGQVTGNKKDRSGRVVLTKLGEKVLEEVALSSGGAYFRATRKGDEIKQLYEEISGLEKREFESQMTESYEDRFQWLLGFALMGLLGEFFVSSRRRVKEQWTGRSSS